MKFLEILLSFLSQQGKGFVTANTDAVTQRVAENARRVVKLLVFIALGIALFCIGFSMAFSGTLVVLERNIGWTWTPSILGGALLAILAVGLLIYSLGEDRWLEAAGLGRRSSAPTAPPPPPSGPTLESALALVIIEVVNEFKERRQHAPPNPGEAPPV